MSKEILLGESNWIQNNIKRAKTEYKLYDRRSIVAKRKKRKQKQQRFRAVKQGEYKARVTSAHFKDNQVVVTFEILSLGGKRAETQRNKRLTTAQLAQAQLEEPTQTKQTVVPLKTNSVLRRVLEKKRQARR